MAVNNDSCTLCGIVGKKVLTNSLDVPKYQFQTTKEFNLGNGLILDDPGNAVKAFMKRDFSQIQDCAQNPHSLIVTEEEVVSGSCQNINKNYKQFVKILKELLEKCKIKNTIVICNWKDFDVIVVSEPLKAIIHFDLNQSWKEKSNSVAKSTCSKLKEALTSNVPLPEREKWNLNSVLHSFKIPTLEICKSCNQFVISPETNLETWWEQFKKLQWLPEIGGDAKTYELVVSQLLSKLFWCSNLPKSQEENIGIQPSFFWGRCQNSALFDPEKYRLILIGSHGTGKTKLMRERARQLKDDNKKVIFILFNELSKPLSSLEKDLANCGTVNVVSSLGNTLEQDVRKIISKNSSSNFFLDNLVFGNQKESFLNDLATEVAEASYLWIASEKIKQSGRDKLNKFKFLNLTQPIGYSRNVIKTSEVLRDELNVTSWPPTENFSKHLPELKLPTLLLSNEPIDGAVKTLCKVLAETKLKTIIVVDFNENEKINEISHALQKADNLKGRLLQLLNEGETEVKGEKFVNSNDKVILVTSKSAKMALGYKVPQLVIFMKNLQGNLFESFFHICEVRLILICQNELAVKMECQNEEFPFCKIIPNLDNLPSTNKDSLNEKTFQNKDTKITIDEEPEKEDTQPEIPKDVKSTSSKFSKLLEKINWKYFGISLSIAFIALISILAFVFSPKSTVPITGDDLLDCRSDGFVKLETVKFTKMFFVTTMMAFSNMQSKCKELHAELWDVRNENEWKTVLTKIKGSSLDIWLNGKVEDSTCPSGEECSRINATRGAGLPLKWETGDQLAAYSRLYKGATSEKKCVIVEDNGENLWTMAYCDYEEHNGICIKRNCKEN